MQVFQCPSCKTKMQASEAHAGKKVACPGCGAHVKVPSPEAPADAIEAAPAVASTAAAPPDEPAAITTPENVAAARKPKGKDRDNDDRDTDDREDDDRADDKLRRRGRSAASAAATGAAVGTSVGLIVLIVVGVTGCVVLGIGGILVALLVPAVSKVREAAARTQTMNNMKQMTIGAHAHHDQFKRLPPPRMARQVGPQIGQPVDLSWRVSVLPYIEQGPMFQRFDQNNPWDHASNQPFLSQRPPIFGNPTRAETDSTLTTFQYFTGPNTMFLQQDHARTLANVPDGTSNTFLFAEAQTGVPWTKPADMVIGAGALPLPADKFLAAMADGAVRIVDRKRVDDRVLRLLIDPADGQALPPDW